MIRVATHRRFSRVGEDLETELEVDYVMAALGGSAKVDTLRGAVDMKIPAGSQSGQIFRLSGQGITKMNGGKGNLLVRLKIAIPKSVSGEEKRLLEEIWRLRK